MLRHTYIACTVAGLNIAVYSTDCSQGVPAFPSLGHGQGKVFGFEGAKLKFRGLSWVRRRGNEVEGLLYWVELYPDIGIARAGI